MQAGCVLFRDKSRLPSVRCASFGIIFNSSEHRQSISMNTQLKRAPNKRTSVCRVLLHPFYAAGRLQDITSIQKRQLLRSALETHLNVRCMRVYVTRFPSAGVLVAKVMSFAERENSFRRFSNSYSFVHICIEIHSNFMQNFLETHKIYTMPENDRRLNSPDTSVLSY